MVPLARRRWYRRCASLLRGSPFSHGEHQRYTDHEWDAAKAARNLKKHGLPFEEAATVFLNPLALTLPDLDQSAAETREITIVHTLKERVVSVARCERGKRIRLICSRVARPGRSGHNMKKLECTPKVRGSGIEHFRDERRTADEKVAAVHAGVQGPGG